jgi:hypothetical protein
MKQRDDAGHASNDMGVFVLAVRRATATDDVSADGDYAPLHVDANGALRTIDNTTLVDDAAFTPATSRVQPVGFFADETSTDSVTEGDIGAARMTLDRRQLVVEQPYTTGGLTWSKTISAATTNATNVKASGGNLYFIHASNINAAARYLKIYNTAAAPNVGTDTPSITLLLPASRNESFSFPLGVTFPAGISFALTTGVADSDTAAVAANELVVHIGYA